MGQVGDVVANGQVVVLLEGRSDVAALRALAAVRGGALDPDRVQLVDMGGATNIRRHVRARLHPGHPTTVLGLCDAGEAPFFLRALRAEGLAVHHPEDMAAHGFHVCHDDLEDELIRALGPSRVVDLLGELRLAEQFDTFCRQPAWRGRAVHEQLHRFAGTTSGRKEALAAAFAGALSPDQVPAPLARLLDQVSAALGGWAAGASDLDYLGRRRVLRDLGPLSDDGWALVGEVQSRLAPAAG